MAQNRRMGLLRKIFGEKDKEAPADSGPQSSQFHESEATTEQGSRNAPRRELVQLVLRDTMRLHGIPSDWIECRILSVVSRSRLAGIHVTFIVRQGEDRLLTYVHAFQHSFVRELEKFEPRARDWLFSVSWQFEGRDDPGAARMPDPAVWGGAVAPPPPAEAATATARPGDDDDDLEQDLKTLYAIRDAVLKQEPVAQEHPDFEPTRPGDVEEEPRPAS
jgi:hypothetical protein